MFQNTLPTKLAGAQSRIATRLWIGLLLITLPKTLPKHNYLTDDSCDFVNLQSQNPVSTQSWLIIYAWKPNISPGILDPFQPYSGISILQPKIIIITFHHWSESLGRCSNYLLGGPIDWGLSQLYRHAISWDIACLFSCHGQSSIPTRVLPGQV